MPRADESDAPRTDRNPAAVSSDSTEHTPNTVGATVSTDRPIAQTPSSDTLLSAPQATRADLALDERLAAVERTVRDHARQLAELAERRPQQPASSGQIRWFWLVFLAGLALAWQILAHVR
jgi:hypothetical protein